MRGRDASSRVAKRRLALLFSAGFVALFVIVGASQGLGDPSIPSGDVVLVEDVPGDGGKISQEDFEHALLLASAQAGVDKPPKPGEDKYEEVRDMAVSSLLEAAWFEGQAAEMGIEVSDAEVARELKKVKKESFRTKAAFQKFLKESKFTEADVNQRVKLQILSTEIQEEFREDLREPTQDEIENYYEATKAAQFTTPATRDLRLIVNKGEVRAKEALAALEKDSTAKNWAKVAKKYSEEAGSKQNGGKQEGVQEGMLEEPLNDAVFNAREGQLEGPIDVARGFTVFEVTNSSDESVQALKDLESQIESQLSQRIQQEDFEDFVADFTAKWTSRTFCADGYVTEQCSNFEGDGRPATASPGCYEADPEGGRPEACPAPVFQLIPAQPGTITPLEPKGKALAQRPVPMPNAEAGGGAVEGLPEGTVPPPGE